MPELPLFIQSTEARSKAFSAQKITNFYGEAGQQGAKSPMVLYGRPGLTSFATVGAGPIRGIHTMGGTPFIVSGSDVFTLASDGTSTNIGTIGGTDIVDMADNGTQVCIVSNGKGFIATTSTVTQITDPDFRVPSSVTFQDSYFIFSEKDSAIIFRSAPLDGFTYDALDYATAEYKSDNLTRVFSDRDELLPFGLNTTEFWYNSGSTGLSFEPIQGKVYEVGCLARDSVALLDNTVFFLGSDERGGRTVFRAAGQPTRVSNHYIERRLDDATNPEDAYAFTFRIEGHAFYVLTIKDYATFVYDASMNEWFDWETQGQNDWSVIGFSNAFNKRLTGSSRSNKIYNIDLDAYDDDGDYFTSEAVSAVVSTPDNQLARHNFLRVDIEAGVGLTSGQGSDPEILLSWSDDGARFNNWKPLKMGKIGESLHRAFLRRLGTSRTRNYKIRITDPIKRVVMGVYINLQGGRW